MRDILVVTIVVLGALAALRRPWIGVMLWTWLSLMNPHRLAFGWAFDAPLAALTAISTLIGLALTPEREWPVKGPPVVWLLLFMGWMTLSWRFGLDPIYDYTQWNKVMKIDFMILVSLVLLHTKRHIMALAWVAAGSLAILGAKGGVFTLLSGGNFRVWGPPETFIEDNNEFALALVMTIPLLRFLQMQLASKWGRRALTVMMLLCATAAVGSHSRGSMLALVAMSAVLWWRGRNKLAGGVLIVAVALAVLAFMPAEWDQRMESISDYEEDESAMGRISAWWNAWNLAFHYPFGVGFDAARPELFAIYSPYPTRVHAAHSIYFQVLGNHGFVGLAIFLSIWLATWLCAGSLRSAAAVAPEAKWCADLGNMVQVSLVAYALGGAFLSLSYFDLPYNLMVMVVLARVWFRTRGWEREALPAPPAPAIGRFGIAAKAN